MTKKNISSFLFTLFLSIPLFGGSIENHLKNLGEKPPFNQMANIDYAYVINLDERPEKLQGTLQQLAPYNISPYRFSAINGWKLSVEELNELGVVYSEEMPKDFLATTYLPENRGAPHDEIMHVLGRTYFCQHMSPGTIAINLSHLSILEDALKCGYNTIWVMEDDIEVIQNPHKISPLIEKLDALVGADGWDILFTDRDAKGQDGSYVLCLSAAPRPNFAPLNPERFAKRTPMGRDFVQIGARYGAYSMIVRRSGMLKISNFIKTHKIFLPYDMDYYLANDIRCFSVKRDIVSTIKDALSDNSRPRYKK